MLSSGRHSCRDDQLDDDDVVPAPLLPCATIERCDEDVNDGGSGGGCHRATGVEASLGGFQVGEAGGVGEPGETVNGLGTGLDGGEEAPTVAEADRVAALLVLPDAVATPATPAMLLPRRWQSAHCIRKRVTASRGRNAYISVICRINQLNSCYFFY